MAAMPANANTLAFSPFSHSSPWRIHHAGHFMARNARIGDSWPAAFDDDRIAVAHTTCMNSDAHLSRAWIGNPSSTILRPAPASVTWAAFMVVTATAVVIKSPIFCLFEL